MGNRVVIESRELNLHPDPAGDRLVAILARKYGLDAPDYEDRLRFRITEYKATNTHMPWAKGTKLKYPHRVDCGDLTCPQNRGNITGRASRKPNWVKEAENVAGTSKG